MKMNPEKVKDAQIIGRNLREIRLACGASQTEIGDIVGVSFQQVQKYEKGKSRLPADKLFLLRQHFGVPYEIFFEGLVENSNQEIKEFTDIKKLLLKFSTITDCRKRRTLYESFMLILSI